ncbi:MAG: hypothetical protein HXY34_13270, partial [Candidatus Thorarchaeota archaeon]|nr:hypothetical protein [Candidatus Thorarchaeota archaeon]
TDAAVLAGPNLDLLFVGLLSHFARALGRTRASVVLEIVEADRVTLVRASVTDGPTGYLDGISKILSGKKLPNVTTVDLDLFLCKLLLDDYGVHIAYYPGTPPSIAFFFGKGN